MIIFEIIAIFAVGFFAGVVFFAFYDSYLDQKVNKRTNFYSVMKNREYSRQHTNEKKVRKEFLVYKNSLFKTLSEEGTFSFTFSNDMVYNKALLDVKYSHYKDQISVESDDQTRTLTVKIIEKQI